MYAVLFLPIMRHFPLCEVMAADRGQVRCAENDVKQESKHEAVICLKKKQQYNNFNVNLLQDATYIFMAHFIQEVYLPRMLTTKTGI